MVKKTIAVLMITALMTAFLVANNGNAPMAFAIKGTVYTAPPGAVPMPGVEISIFFIHKVNGPELFWTQMTDAFGEYYIGDSQFKYLNKTDYLFMEIVFPNTVRRIANPLIPYMDVTVDVYQNISVGKDPGGSGQGY